MEATNKGGSKADDNKGSNGQGSSKANNDKGSNGQGQGLLKPPYLKVDVSGAPDLPFVNQYQLNFLSLSCPATGTQGWEATVALRLPERRSARDGASSLSLSMVYKYANLPAGAACSATIFCWGNGWSNLQVIVSVAY
jgi:hypothetical protein